jgi:hypothetical protein
LMLARNRMAASTPGVSQRAVPGIGIAFGPKMLRSSWVWELCGRLLLH